MEYPSKLLEKAVNELAQLPGIGKRTSMRLILHLLKRPSSQTIELTDALNHLINDIKYCKKCYSLSDTEICSICNNPHRNSQLICIVEDVRDVMAIENTGQYRGLYHVLGGKISPMEGIGPAQLQISSLKERLESESVEELIFALSATMEGDTTAFYLYKLLKNSPVKFSSIARGLGIGDELEYADEATLIKSLQNRIPYQDNNNL